MSLEEYKTRFARLRVDIKPYWPDATFNRAPYKPLLLLAVMDLMAHHVIDGNLIRLNVDLIDAFDRYWAKIVHGNRESNPVMPFNHLRSESFWHLIDRHGSEPNLQNIDRNELFRRIKHQELFARVDDALFQLLRTADTRDELRRVLIEKYFVPALRPTIVEISRITTDSFAYSRELLNRSRGRFHMRESPSVNDAYVPDVRSVAFRRVVVEAYNHTCAVCRIRIVTPEGRTSVAAAHIVPWSQSHNDDPRNGLALCGLHHWIFDQGLIGVTSDYTIKISPVLMLEAQHVMPVIALEGKELYKPADRILWPANGALQWHMQHIFRPAHPYPLL